MYFLTAIVIFFAYFDDFLHKSKVDWLLWPSCCFCSVRLLTIFFVLCNKLIDHTPTYLLNSSDGYRTSSSTKLLDNPFSFFSVILVIISPSEELVLIGL